MNRALFDSPIGLLNLAEEEGAITRIWFPDEQVPDLPLRETKLLTEAKRQLEEYFSGTRRSFDLILDPGGTEFQQRCWKSLRDIPYGGTISYGELARRIGQPKASRAVGQANHCNPIPIFIPCHRVIGADGSLTGFGGGLHRKEFLLRLEREQMS